VKDFAEVFLKVQAKYTHRFLSSTSLQTFKEL